MRTLKLSCLVISFGIITAFTGCTEPECDFKSEPSLTLEIQDETVNYTSGYALKNNAALEGTNNSFSLPISLNDEFTVYVFQAANGVADTLELRYTKDVQYTSNECGFTIRLENMSSGVLTSFSSPVIISEKIIYIQ